MHETEYRKGNWSETALMYFPTLVLVPLLSRGATKAFYFLNALAVLVQRHRQYFGVLH